MLSVLLIILACVFLLAGLVGCILPVLPGPALAFLALICLALDEGWDILAWWEWLGIAVTVAAVTALDTVIPVLGAKKYGASRAGLWLSVLGMLVGLVLFPPLGMLVGAWLGAFFGEMLAGKSSSEALPAAWGVFVGTIAGTGLKVVTCLVIGVYYFAKLV